jgi:hypothetical protein
VCVFLVYVLYVHDASFIDDFLFFGSLLQADGELASLSLVVPPLNPIDRAQRAKCLEENLAWLKVLALDVDALVVINVRLRTVLRLVLVRESRVELGSLELESSGVKCHREV